MSVALQYLRRYLKLLLDVILHEWPLTWFRVANGGDIIIVRSVLVATQLYVAIVATRLTVATGSLSLEWSELRASLLDTGPWYGPLFAGVYASLYGRYASQWTYLANAYNRIKETETRGVPINGAVPLAQWKAAFIEHADDLHLAMKPMFMSVLRAWATDIEVERAFKRDMLNGAARWEKLMRRLKRHAA